MEYKKYTQWQSNYWCGDYCNNDHNRFVYLIFSDHSYNHIYYQHDHRAYYSNQKQYKKSVISFSYAVIHKWTMMIKNLHAVIAWWTMTWTRWAVNLTCLAISSFLFSFLIVILRNIQKLADRYILLLFWWVLCLLSL